MILFAFSSTRLDSTMPASSIVSRNSNSCAAVAVWIRLERSEDALLVTGICVIDGNSVGLALIASAAISFTGPSQRAIWPAVPISSGAPTEPARIAA